MGNAPARYGKRAFTVLVRSLVGNEVKNASAYVVQPGDVVTIEPFNNTADCIVSTQSSEEAALSFGIRVKSTSLPREIKVRDLSEIWVRIINAQEGIVITVNPGASNDGQSDSSSSSAHSGLTRPAGGPQW